jgi:hypothetical protein
VRVTSLARVSSKRIVQVKSCRLVDKAVKGADPGEIGLEQSAVRPAIFLSRVGEALVAGRLNAIGLARADSPELAENVGNAGRNYATTSTTCNRRHWKRERTQPALYDLNRRSSSGRELHRVHDCGNQAEKGDKRQREVDRRMDHFASPFSRLLSSFGSPPAAVQSSYWTV